jgi:hypothetical protein
MLIDAYEAHLFELLPTRFGRAFLSWTTRLPPRLLRQQEIARRNTICPLSVTHFLLRKNWILTIIKSLSIKNCKKGIMNEKKKKK